MNIDMEGLIGEMSELIAKIKEGSATQGEIEAFAAAAAQLNERAIVLRYKAYESKIFGTPMEQPVEVESHSHFSADPIETLEDTPLAEEVVTTEAAVESNDPDISFSLFEEKTQAKQAEPEGFDLFSMDDDEEEELLPDFEEEDRIDPQPEAEKAAEKRPEPEATKEDQKPETEVPSWSAETPAAEIHNPEPVIEQPVVAAEEPKVEAAVPEEMAAPAHTTPAEERPVLAEATMEFSAPYDELMPKVEEAPAPIKENTFSSDEPIHPLYNRLTNNDDSLAAKLMSVRLDTLKGAFGFNERMQIVQELFRGDNDAFSEAIDTLDQLGSKNEARSKVTGYANRFAWDERSDLVMEFVQKVERRYA